MTRGRLIAIGDIHGCSAALSRLLEATRPAPEDTIVALGDYVDRGPDSRGTIDELLRLAERCQLVPLLGNHDEMLLQVFAQKAGVLQDWLAFGGEATLASYAVRDPLSIPPGHLSFLRDCREYYETERHFFVHASYDPDLPLRHQPPELLRWISLKIGIPGPHISGKTAIAGHSAQKSGEILDLGYIKCIDTCCYGNGWLSALDVHTGQVWQADKRGALRGER